MRWRCVSAVKVLSDFIRDAKAQRAVCGLCIARVGVERSWQPYPVFSACPLSFGRVICTSARLSTVTQFEQFEHRSVDRTFPDQAQMDDILGRACLRTVSSVPVKQESGASVSSSSNADGSALRCTILFDSAVLSISSTKICPPVLIFALLAF
jgi:hypothetical protein